MPIHNCLLRLPSWAMTAANLTRTRTGVFGYRKRVPNSLRSVIDRTEIIKSLGTRDPDEAKARHKEVDAEVERLFRETKKQGKLPEADVQKQAVAWLRSKGFEIKPYEQFDRDENEYDARSAIVDKLLAEHG
jgi:hypothetical protein